MFSIRDVFSKYIADFSSLKVIMSRSVYGYSDLKIWESKLSWKIAGVVFITLTVIQASIVTMSIGVREAEKIADVTEIARSSLFASIDPERVKDFSVPFDDEVANRIIASTPVEGMSIYSIDYNLIKTFGNSPKVINLFPGNSPKQKQFISTDGNNYEVLLAPIELGSMYYIVTRIDTSEIRKQINNFVYRELYILLLMSAFVTCVLMLALGKELLEPLLFMKSIMRNASENPENPEIPEYPYKKNDTEIGEAISQAVNLIRQNSQNINKIKSTAEDQIHRLAYFDTLTGLPNRTQFLQKLVEESRDLSDEKNACKLAVVTMDLDHFKDVNDSMGHNVGDAILRSIGKRLRTELPERAIVSRSGEDEFAVMMKLDEEMPNARDVGNKVLEIIRSMPFKVFNETFQIRASVGVSTYPDDGTDISQILKNADIALNRSKEEGRDSLREYSEDFDIAVQQRFTMLRDLRVALEEDQLSLFFQPQINLKTGEIIGAEALLRWWKPNDSKAGGSYIPPGTFIPIAEQSGLMITLGEWVLRKACEVAVEWEEKFGKPLRVAVNISGAQFYQGDLTGYIKKTLQETGVNPANIELEVTESAFMEDIGKTIRVLHEIHDMGAEIAIDDFGTGYSSLSYLRQFPIDRLKIDQSFIRNALINSDDASITRTIIGLGNTLGLKVIAEGVETKEHEEFLVSEGCHEAQGYRYSKPIDNESFIKFIKEYNGDISSFG